MELLILLSFILIIASRICAGCIHEEPIVKLTGGTIKGFCDNKPANVAKFLGISYAEPPVGPLRFQPPRFPLKWTGIRTVSRFAQACIQDEDWLQGKFRDDNYFPSEDCLYLNVYVPGSRNFSDSSSPADLAVMVWIHGGEFQRGTASLYDPSRLVAANNVIVVTINYRLGVLGFLSIQKGNFGNFGLRDQTMALTWVRRNIAAFGGNKNLVTLFGHEAGAAAIMRHVASRKSQGLFHRAICQSTMPTTLQYPPKNTTSLLASYVRCATPNIDDSITCLRQRTIIEIKSTIKKINKQLSTKNTDLFGPSEGDNWMPVDPNYNFTNGIYSKYIQILLGTSANEGITELYSPMSRRKFELNMDVIAKSLRVSDHQKVSRMIFSRYMRDQSNGDYRPAIAAVTNDIITAWTQDQVRLLSMHGTKVFSYRFSHTPSFAVKPSYLAREHDGFNFFVMGQFAKMTTDETALSMQIMNAWSFFAKTGTPMFQNKYSVEWNPYTLSNQSYVDLRMPLGPGNVKSRLNEDADIFWNEVVQTFKIPSFLPSVPHDTSMSPVTAREEEVGQFFGWTSEQSEIVHIALLIVAGAAIVVCIVVVIVHVCYRRRVAKRNNMYNVETKTNRLSQAKRVTANGKDNDTSHF